MTEVSYKEACKAANCRETTRQWKKWLKGRGIARAVRNGTAEPLPKSHPAHKSGW
jgi:hypothetical protein